jgi:hypothetical protein
MPLGLIFKTVHFFKPDYEEKNQTILKTEKINRQSLNYTPRLNESLSGFFMN